MRKGRTAQCWGHRNIKQSAVTAAEDRSKTKHHTDVGFLDLNDVSKSCCENIMPYIIFFLTYMPPMDVQTVTTAPFFLRGFGGPAFPETAAVVFVQ